ncbi:MAG TPA: hypothetical protein VHW00_15995 [Thermoanaerobaculia bacterium]|nr:hypothetical protein [Thermoanaerobaculia bacterium]
MTDSFVRAIAVALLTLAMTAPGFAGPNRWTSNGPASGYVNVLTVDPKNPAVVYAGAPGGGIYKSWDGGQNWFRINRGLATNTAVVGAIAIDPVDTNIVYAGLNGGMYKSTDAGAHWTRLLNYGYSASFLVLDPKNPSTLYTGYGAALYKSIDGGAQFTPLTLPTTNILDLAIDNENPSILYAAAADETNGGVYKTIDGGAHWDKVSAAIPTRKVYTLAIDPKNPANVWAGTSNGGVWLSTDRGGSWTKKSGGASGMPDGGNYQVAAVSASGTAVYFGSNGGLWVTNNGGTTWSSVAPPSESFMIAIAPDRVAASTVYVSTDFGIHKSTNSGATWSRQMNGVSTMEPVGFAADPVNPDVAYAFGSDGVFKTVNGGESWERAGDRRYVNGIAIDPQNPAVLYAQHQVMFSKSTNGGASWTNYTAPNAPNGNVSMLVHDPVKAATIYAATTSQGLWSSANGGAWTALNNGLPAGARISQIAFDAATPSTMYVATNSGIYRSSSSGASWSPMNSGLASTNTTGIVSVKASPATLYAIADARLYKSTNSASTWTDITASGMSNVYTVAVTGSGSDLFVGTNLYVWRSRDGGATFTTLRAGREFGYTKILALNHTNTRLYAGGYRGGAHAIELSPVLLPVAASVHGNGGSFFHSDVMLVNPSPSSAMDVQATYRCFIGTCANASKTITIAPRQAIAYSDVVAGLFGAAETGGPIEFDAPSHLIATSRLYTPSKPAPTFGQFVPGLTADAATTRGVLPLLSNGANGGGFRSNLGLYNPNDSSENVTITLYSDAGAILGSITRTLAAKSGTQINNIFEAAGSTNEIAGAFAIVTSAKPVVSYASVLDNQSQDPIFVVAQDGVEGMSGTITVPAAASLHGQGGAFFHSDVSIVNVSNELANITAYYRCSSGNCGTSPKTFTIPAGQQRTYEDVVVSLFGATESGGAIEFVTAGRIAVASRLYTPSKPAPTFGQYVPGLPSSRAAGHLVVPSLSASTNSAVGFRTNVGVFNASDITHDVTFSLHALDGTLLGATTRNVGARQLVQINNIFGVVGVTSDVASAYCVIEGFGNVPLFGFASVLDNQSQDPIFVVGEADGQ